MFDHLEERNGVERCGRQADIREQTRMHKEPLRARGGGDAGRRLDAFHVKAQFCARRQKIAARAADVKNTQ